MPLEITGPITVGPQGYLQTTKVYPDSELVNRFGAGFPRSFHERRVTTRRKKPAGWLDPTAYERTTTVSRHQECVTERVRKSIQPVPGFSYGYEVRGLPPACLSRCENVSLPSVSSNEINRAVTGALLKLKDQKVNLAQAWAERQMTANLLADSITRIAKSIQALRSGKWRKAGRYLKQNWKKAPSSWLEYQYGWNPLLQDVYGSCEALTYKETQSWIMTVKEVVAIRGESESLFDTGLEAGTHSTSEFRGAFVRLDYIPNHSFFQVLSQTGFTNPLQLQWELVPFSFVLDWGFAVGDWLSVMDATVGWEFKSGSLTTLQSVTSKVKLRRAADNATWRHLRGEGEMWHRKKSLKRTPYGSSPLPRAPVYKNPASLGHVANALALLSQVLKPGPVRVR
jgi:hypothetical protein